MEGTLKFGNTRKEECEAENAPKEEEFKRKMDVWVQSGGRQPEKPFTQDCWQYADLAMNQFSRLSAEHFMETYRREGFADVAAYSVIPPIVGYIAIFAAMGIFGWIKRGFVRP
jgi:hypothetical protein